MTLHYMQNGAKLMLNSHLLWIVTVQIIAKASLPLFQPGHHIQVEDILQLRQ